MLRSNVSEHSTPVTMPQRIDDELCKILSEHLPLYVNTHFNHPQEITPRAQEACFKLARTGVSLGNQTVLLKGINNDPFVIRKLNQDLLKIMVQALLHFPCQSGQRNNAFQDQGRRRALK
jgi:L-lysine 2,3-aminomutase